MCPMAQVSLIESCMQTGQLAKAAALAGRAKQGVVGARDFQDLQVVAQVLDAIVLNPGPPPVPRSLGISPASLVSAGLGKPRASCRNRLKSLGGLSGLLARS